MKRVFIRWGSIAATVILLSLLLTINVFAESKVNQPPVTSPGASAQNIEKIYLQEQVSLNATEEEKVKSAVDAFFKVKYESWVKQQAFDPGFSIGLTNSSGRDLYNYELGLLKYSIFCWERTNTIMSSYLYQPEYESVIVDKDSTIVKIRPWVSITYADIPNKPDKLCGETHVIELLKSNNGWKLIRDSYQDDFTRGFPYGTDFDKLQNTYETRVKEAKESDSKITEELTKLKEDPRLKERFTKDKGSNIAQGDISIQGTIYYNRDSASTYGKTYATSYNTKFKSYSSDCQNFVSQCIWYGFGGVNTTTAIEAHNIPMVDNISGATNWWADYDGTDPNWCWTGVTYFESMIKNNYNNNKVGVQGYQGSLGSTLKGDYLSRTDFEHVYIVTGVTDLDGDYETDYNELYVSAHTANYNNVRLSTIAPDPSKIRYMWIVWFKSP